MRFEHLSISNYRQFYGENKIPFSKIKDGKNICIIQGENGRGKTNILNAITWCLYGDEINVKKNYDKEKMLPLVNIKIRDESPQGTVIDVNVEIQMRDDDNKSYTFSRKLGFKKNPDGTTVSVPIYSQTSRQQPDGSLFELLYQEGNDIKHAFAPEVFIERFFPFNIREYFFFDGEQLEKYFTTSSSDRIEQAVFDVSQITIVEKAQKELSKIHRKFVNELKNLDPKLQDLQQRVDAFEKSKQVHLAELAQKKTERDEAIKNESKINQELREKSSIPNIRELDDRRKKLEDEVKNFIRLRESLTEKKNDALLSKSSIIYCIDAILDTLQKIEEKTKKGELPPKIKRVFIEDILKAGKCICGSDISLHTTEKNKRQAILDFLESTDKISDISEKIVEGRTILRSMIDSVQDFESQQLEFSKEIGNVEKQITSNNEEVSSISKKIKGYNIDEITLLEESLQKFKQLIISTSEDISRINQRIESTNSSIKQTRKDIEEEVKKQGAHTEISKMLSFTNDSINALEEIKQEIMTELRVKIQNKTKEHFFNLIWKESHGNFKDVIIDDKYNIDVIYETGESCLFSLSAGEQLVLALSFMAALNEISGFQSPIVIDTPVGRISEKVKENIADCFNKYLKTRQVLILPTDTEYSSEVRKRLYKSVCDEYRIKFSNGAAKVVKYE